MSNNFEVDVAVIGGGPAGLAASLKASEAGCSVIVLERDNELGGILQQCIHNGFGLKYFKEELTGPEYAQRFINKIVKSEIKIFLNSMVIELTHEKFITAINAKLGLIHVKAKSVVLAMGCRERTRGAINIPGARPSGIFPAGQAQRFINIEGYLPGHRVLILGSGDIGMIMARRCTLEGMKVLAVAEVLPYASGLTRNKVQCLDDYGIPLYLRHTITDIRERNGRVEGITISKIDEKWRPISGTEKTFDLDTILFSVGLIPENELTKKAGCKLANNGGPNVNEYLQTTIPGIFACGNVLQVHDLVDWVSSEAEICGINASQYAKNELIIKPKDNIDEIIIKPGTNVGYIVPERIDCLTKGKYVRFSFRVKNPRSNIRVQFISKGRVFYNRRKKFVLPSEMIHIKAKLNPVDIGSNIVINVIEKEQLINVIEKEMLEEK